MTAPAISEPTTITTTPVPVLTLQPRVAGSTAAAAGVISRISSRTAARTAAVAISAGIQAKDR
jgi:hypothetical protein